MPDLKLDPDADDPKLLAQVVDYYHRTLKETTEGLDYLRRRGITVGEAIDRFRIGYANRTLGLKLPHMRLKAGKHIRTRLQQVGIYRGSGHEHLQRLRDLPHHCAPMAAVASWTSTGARPAIAFARARPCTCTSVTSGKACGTSRHLPPATRSSSARRSSTPWRSGTRATATSPAPSELKPLPTTIWRRSRSSASGGCWRRRKRSCRG